MIPPTQLLLEEFCKRVGLDAPPHEPDAFTGMVIDDLLITLDTSDTKLKLLTTVDLPAGREEEVLNEAAAYNEGRDEAGGPVVSFAETGVLVVFDEIDASETHYPEFEERLTGFVALCERLGKPAPTETEGDPVPSHAIYG